MVDSSTRGPTFVVAGAGRAGTTALVEGLRAHPDVFVTTPKEPHYLALHNTRPMFQGPSDDETMNRRVVTTEREYRALYASSANATVRGEASVSTLYYYERAIPELLRINPEIKVVVLLREPVSRAWSSYLYLRGQGREPEQNFLAALEDEQRRRAKNWHHLWHYTAMSRYAEGIEALQAQVIPGHLGVWFYDDIDRDYGATFDAVRSFLGVPKLAGVGEDSPRVNVSGQLRYPRTQQCLSWAARQAPIRHGVQRCTSWKFREAVRLRLIRNQAVPERVISEVAPQFEADLARLRDLLPQSEALPAWLSTVRPPSR